MINASRVLAIAARSGRLINAGECAAPATSAPFSAAEGAGASTSTDAGTAAASQATAAPTQQKRDLWARKGKGGGGKGMRIVQTPDEFLSYQWEIEDPDYLLGVLEVWALALKKPPLTLEELLDRLAKTTPSFSETVLAFSRGRASR